MNKRHTLPFAKLVASGNDFILIDNRRQTTEGRRQKTENSSLPALARTICDRQYGAGADGLLVIGPSRRAAAQMSIFNPDGSEAEMCGNGARCAALWVKRTLLPRDKAQQIALETRAGTLVSEVRGNVDEATVKIRMPDPYGVRLRIPLKVGGKIIRVQFINTGVPHTAVFVEGLAKIDVEALGRAIRYHKRFKPGGTNVDFVEISGDTAIGVRTYERGVESETLACGTGAAASALVSSLSGALTARAVNTVNVRTKSGEKLRVYFNRRGSRIDTVWLEGNARIVYKGEYYYV